MSLIKENIIIKAGNVEGSKRGAENSEAERRAHQDTNSVNCKRDANGSDNLGEQMRAGRANKSDELSAKEPMAEQKPLSPKKAYKRLVFESLLTHAEPSTQYQLSPKPFAMGSFAKIFRGVQISTKQEVAIKEISSTNSVTLRQEVLLLSFITHPLILKLKQAFQYGTHLWIVTELLGLGALSQFALSAHTPPTCLLPNRMIAKIMGLVFEAVDHLHSLHIVHMDLKPENIMFSPDSGIKLIDFGFAEPPSSATHLLRSDRGSILYMSIERLGDAWFSTPSDIWSLAISILYLFGDPYPGWGSLDILDFRHKVTHYGGPWSSPAHFAMIPEKMRACLNGCLNVDIKERFTAKQVLQNEFLSDACSIAELIAYIMKAKII